MQRNLIGLSVLRVAARLPTPMSLSKSSDRGRFPTILLKLFWQVVLPLPLKHSVGTIPWWSDLHER